MLEYSVYGQVKPADPTRKIEMFTGIVAGTAPIVKIEEKDFIRTFTVDLDEYIDNLEIGASVALDGVCMTVVSIENNLVKRIK